MTRYILILITLLSTVSCGEEFFNAPIEFDLEEIQREITVVGRLVNTDSDVFTDFESINNLGFFISRSKSVLDSTNFEIVENASVNLSGSDGTEISYLLYEDSGYYFPENTGNPEFSALSVNDNTEYKLTVDVPGEELVTATCSTGTFGKLESAEVELNDITPDDFYTLDKLKLEINDPPGNNYYLLRTFYKTTEIGLDGSVFTRQDQGYIYSVSTALDGEARLFTDELFDGTSISLEFWSERYTGSNNEAIDPETIFINLWTLTEEEYEFRESIRRNNEAVDNPFAEPSVVFNNIENGIGVFSLSKAQILEIKL